MILSGIGIGFIAFGTLTGNVFWVWYGIGMIIGVALGSIIRNG